VSFLPPLVTREMLAVDGGGGAAIFQLLQNYSIAQEQLILPRRWGSSNVAGVVCIQRLALFSSQTVSRPDEAKAIPDTQIDGFDQASANGQCSPL
jgi:hypothetical protein